MVYTNIDSYVAVRGYIDGALGSNFNITTQFMDFNDGGLNREVKNEKIFGDSIYTIIEDASELEVGFTLLIENDSQISPLLHYANNLTAVEGQANCFNYAPTDKNRRFRFILVWADQDSNNYYMKMYYNLYIEKISVSKSDAVEIIINGKVPATDLKTGYGNYYEYEGTNYLSMITAIDTRMLWHS